MILWVVNSGWLQVDCSADSPRVPHVVGPRRSKMTSLSCLQVGTVGWAFSHVVPHLPEGQLELLHVPHSRKAVVAATRALKIWVGNSLGPLLQNFIDQRISQGQPILIQRRKILLLMVGVGKSQYYKWQCAQGRIIEAIFASDTPQ